MRKSFRNVAYEGEERLQVARPCPPLRRHDLECLSVCVLVSPIHSRIAPRQTFLLNMATFGRPLHPLRNKVLSEGPEGKHGLRFSLCSRVCRFCIGLFMSGAEFMNFEQKLKLKEENKDVGR
jgi:hypothetical protein